MKSHQERFGQHPEESQDLVRAWVASQPQVPVQQWDSFWSETQVKAAAAGTAAQSGVTSSDMAGRWVRFGLAASLAGLAWANWPAGPDVADSARVAQQVPVVETLVSINLDEADALAIIRLDDAQCPADRPCLETVEPISAETGGAALASNFQLFNDLESLAGE